MDDLFNIARMNNHSPIEKFKKYGIFPYQLLAHILLTTLSTLQVILVVHKKTSYSRLQEKTMYNYFISDSPNDDGKVSRTRYYFDVNSLQDTVLLTIDKYNKFLQDSLDYISPNNITQTITFNFISNEVMDRNKYLNRVNRAELKDNFNIDNLSYTTNLTYDKGPFELDSSQLKELLTTLTDFRIQFKFITYLPYFYGYLDECYKWHIDQIFKNNNIHFVSHLYVNKGNCIDFDNDSTYLQWFFC